MNQPSVAGLERDVLIAIHQLHGKAYSVSIIAKMQEKFGKYVSLGAVYTTTDRLQKKGFITSNLGDPTPERGGRPKRFFRITASGLRVLQQAKEADDLRWSSIPPGGVPA